MNPLIGIALKVVSALSFTIMAALIKLLSDRFPVGELVFFRSFFALIPLLIWLKWLGEWPHATYTSNRMGHIRRGVVGTAAMFSSFTALHFLPLPEATALGYTTPLIAVALAAIFLRETVRIYRWTAVAIGFIGVLVMLWPQLGRPFSGAPLDAAAIGAAFALAGSLFGGISTIEIRRLTQSETTGAIVFYFSLMSSVMGALTIFLGWRLPTLNETMLLIVIGIFGGIGQILITQAYQYADASLVAPFEYTSMVWALLLGWFVFSELPQTTILVGAGIVILSGLFIILREHQLGLERKRQREASPSKPV